LFDRFDGVIRILVDGSRWIEIERQAAMLGFLSLPIRAHTPSDSLQPSLEGTPLGIEVRQATSGRQPSLLDDVVGPTLGSPLVESRSKRGVGLVEKSLPGAFVASEGGVTQTRFSPLTVDILGHGPSLIRVFNLY
jgi:hypothetical protein